MHQNSAVKYKRYLTTSQKTTSNTVHSKWLLKFKYVDTTGKENAKSSRVNVH